MKEVVRVLEDYHDSESYIVLDKPYYTKPTKFTDGKFVLEIMYGATIAVGKCVYNIRHLSNNPYSKISFPVGTALTEINNPAIMLEVDDSDTITQLSKNPFTESRILKTKQKIVEMEPSKETKKAVKINDRWQYVEEPLYLEEDLVPSQFYGLNDYLKTT